MSFSFLPFRLNFFKFVVVHRMSIYINKNNYLPFTNIEVLMLGWTDKRQNSLQIIYKETASVRLRNIRKT